MANRHSITPAEARGIVLAAHYGQTEKDGSPYINHLDRVAAKVPSEFRDIAYLHDGPEDTWLTIPILRTFGVSEYALECIEVLTHDDDSPYQDYVVDQVIASGLRGAILTKDADVDDHLRPGHELVLNDRQILKYQLAQAALKEEIARARF